MTRSIARCVALVACGLGLFASAHATTLIMQDTRGLVRGSSDIVVGKVAAVRPHWDAEHRHIVTDVDVDVSESLKGEKQRLTLTQLGGEVDGMRLTVPGCPAFKPGEEALLFVWRDARGQAQLNGLGQGKFEIRRDPVTHERYLGRSLPGLGIGDARTLRPLRPGEAPARITLGSMLDRIRAELSNGEH